MATVNKRLESLERETGAGDPEPAGNYWLFQLADGRRFRGDQMPAADWRNVTHMIFVEVVRDGPEQAN